MPSSGSTTREIAMPDATHYVMANSSAKLTSQISLSWPRGLNSRLVVRATQSQCNVKCTSKAIPSPMPSHSWMTTPVHP